MFSSQLSNPDSNNNNSNTSNTISSPDIEIEDIVVRVEGTQQKSKGEFYQKSIYREPRLSRILDLMEMLASIAESHHEKHFNKNQIIPGHENCITRLLMHELMFYTKATPLSAQEFEMIKSAAQALAENLHPNLILIFSSFAVFEKSMVSNKVIFVQSNKKKISVLTKIYASEEDPKYSYEYKVGGLNKKTISCSTLGGQEFLIPISICIELQTKVATWSLLEKFINRIKKNKSLPRKLSHVVTSNSIQIDKGTLSPFSKKNTVQADYEESYIVPNNNATISFHAHLTKKNLQDRLEMKFRKYSKLKIQTNTAGDILTISNPPFGTQLRMQFYPTHKMAYLPTKLNALANEYDEARKLNQSVDFILLKLYKLQFKYFKDMFNIIILNKDYKLSEILLRNPEFESQLNTRKTSSSLHKAILAHADINSLKSICTEQDPNACDFVLKFTPAHLAASLGNVSALKILISCSADISSGDWNDKTPLIHAVENNQWNAAAFILMHTDTVSEDELDYLFTLPNLELALKQAFISQLKSSSQEERKKCLYCYQLNALAICEILQPIKALSHLGLTFFGAHRPTFTFSMDEIMQQLDQTETPQLTGEHYGNK